MHRGKQGQVIDRSRKLKKEWWTDEEWHDLGSSTMNTWPIGEGRECEADEEGDKTSHYVTLLTETW